MELLIGLCVVVSSGPFRLDVVETGHKRVHLWEVPICFSPSGVAATTAAIYS
jgi:hypothetical protein